MKTTDKLKEEILKEVEHSGFMKTMQAQIKAHVYDLIEKESATNRQKLGFQYEHPLLTKLEKFPKTSLCMDLIQEFLESFKFKHTLNVFRKEANRKTQVSRKNLADQFTVEIKNPESQAVLLSLVSQLTSGQLTKKSADQTPKPDLPRTNNFINPTIAGNASKKQPSSSTITGKEERNTAKLNETMGSDGKKSRPNQDNGDQLTSESQSKPADSKVEQNKDSKQDPKKETKKDTKKKQVEKPPQGAKDLLQDVMSKFQHIGKDKEQEKLSLYESKRAFSQDKQKKQLDPSESGTNKIRGVSLEKGNSFLNRFLPQPVVNLKNESQIEEELDKFQLSNNSSLKNLLFSSTDSGIDKNAYDLSVDSNAIENYQYVEKAKKVGKKY